MAQKWRSDPKSRVFAVIGPFKKFSFAAMGHFLFCQFFPNFWLLILDLFVQVVLSGCFPVRPETYMT